MLPLKTEKQIESAVHALSLPLYHVMEKVPGLKPVHQSILEWVVAGALHWRKVPGIVLVNDPDRMKLMSGETTLGEALNADFGKNIDRGLRAQFKTSPFASLACGAMCGVLGFFFIRLGIPASVSISLALLIGFVGVLLVDAHRTSEGIRRVKTAYARLLYPVSQLCDNVQRGSVPLQAPFEAARGHILCTYMGLRLAERDWQAEKMLQLLELELLGVHIIGFDAQGRAFVSAPVVIDEIDEITAKWQRPATVSP